MSIKKYIEENFEDDLIPELELKFWKIEREIIENTKCKKCKKFGLANHFDMFLLCPNCGNVQGLPEKEIEKAKKKLLKYQKETIFKKGQNNQALKVEDYIDE